MKPALRLYGSLLKFSASTSDLFLQKDNDLTLMVDSTDATLLLWEDEIPSKYKFLGTIIAVEGDHVKTDTGRTQVMHPDLLWQIEAALSDGCLTLRTDKQVWFGKSISRAKYHDDKRVHEAEEDHIRKKYGYRQLTAAVKKAGLEWEDEERVVGRKSRR